MLEVVLKGDKKYWGWISFLFCLIGLGAFFYHKQLIYGLSITGMSRDVSWGLYTAQSNFLVGVAAGGIMLVLPYYLHDFKKFGKITILGEFLAVPALLMCLLFLFVHLGKPERFLNVFLYPTPTAMVFWDGVVIMGYLFLNLIIGWTILSAERKAVSPPRWIKPLIYISIPMAFSILTVTAFLYCGLASRGYWFTAILAPRFLASAFSSGPALLILLSFILKRITKFKVERETTQAVAIIVAYALVANIFFLLCEVFVVFYSDIPSHVDHFIYLFKGLNGHNTMVPWMWTSIVLLLLGAVLLVVPSFRKKTHLLIVACLAVFLGTWIDKGLGLMIGGFTPNPFHRVVEYVPTIPEVSIVLGVYGIGLLVLTILYKIVIYVRKTI
jgi:Ni/Fe-hydrogenase subunit HybB-like protein